MLASGRGLRALALAASSLALAAASAEDCALGMPGSVRTRPLRLAALGAESPALLAPGGRDLLPAHSALHAAAGPGGAREGHDAARSRLVYLSQQGRVQQCVRLRGGSDLMKTKPAFLAKMQDGLASSRAAILWVIKGLLAAFTGLLTTSAVMVAFEFTAHKIRPVTGARHPSVSRACVAASPFPAGRNRRAVCIRPCQTCRKAFSDASLSPYCHRSCGDDTGLSRWVGAGGRSGGVGVGQLGADKALAVASYFAGAGCELALHGSAVHEFTGCRPPAVVQVSWPGLFHPAIRAHILLRFRGPVFHAPARVDEVAAFRVSQKVGSISVAWHGCAVHAREIVEQNSFHSQIQECTRRQGA